MIGRLLNPWTLSKNLGHLCAAYIGFNKEQSPLITIVVPAYNEEAFLGACLKSVKQQTYSNFECLVVNDSSVDSTRAIAEEFANKDSRFRVINNDFNKGLSASRNCALVEARGEYITFLDADDFLYPTSLYFRLKTLTGIKELKIAGSYCGIKVVSENGKSSFSFLYPLVNLNLPVVSYEMSKGDCPFNVHAPLVRTDLVRAAGGFDETLLHGAEDWDLWIRLLRNGYEFLPTQKVGAAYRQRQKSMARAKIDQHWRQAERILGSVFETQNESMALPNAPHFHSAPFPPHLKDLYFAPRLIYYFVLAKLLKQTETQRVVQNHLQRIDPAVQNQIDLPRLVHGAFIRGTCKSRYEISTSDKLKIRELINEVQNQFANSPILLVSKE